MITEDVDDSKHLPMTENPEDEDIEDSSKTEQKHQEFAHTKGQLISKCPSGVFKSPKKHNETFSRIPVLASKRDQIKKK